MKQLAVFAALTIGLQAAQRPPQTTQSKQASDARDRARSERAPLGAEPIAALNAERAWAGADTLWPLASDRTGLSDVRSAAVRALGRLEDPRLVAQLLKLDGGTDLADAIAQSLNGFDPVNGPAIVASVWERFWQMAGGESATSEARKADVSAVALAMGRVRYATPEQVREAEEILRALAINTANDPLLEGFYLRAMRGLESLARVNTRLIAFDEETVKRLARSVANMATNDGIPEARRYAFLALVAGRALDPDTARKALADDDWQIRRGAMAVIAGAGIGVDATIRMTLIRAGLRDPSPHVRYEAVRAWARHEAPASGCQPILDAINDDDASVSLQAIDLLGDRCKDSDDITTRLTAEARVPPSTYWHRETHAFVALAKRSPDAAALAMEAFVTHPVWWVRMYATFAAAGAKDLLHLDKLAYDANDNVREAALNHLWALDKERAGRATEAALEREDVQLLRAAALRLKEMPANARLVKPLLGALQRLTKTRSMTTRDGRIALLEAIDHHAKPDDHTDLVPFLRDYDPKVADQAAVVIAHISGKTMKAEPQPEAHVPSQPFSDLRQCVTIDMSPGRAFHLRMAPDLAPIAVEQFLELATTEKYYDGLTFHRIVPNFVIQGGSPGANEYSGYKEYMRDEIAGRQVRGAVGLSTRGRNTGDAQIFINLVDNPRLDASYTAFATVFPEDMDNVDRIQEGDVMRSIVITPCPRPRR